MLTELRAAGYDASADSEPGPSSPIVIVGMRSGGAPDREELRAFLSRIRRVNVDASSDPGDEVPRGRFADEA